MTGTVDRDRFRCQGFDVLRGVVPQARVDALLGRIEAELNRLAYDREGAGLLSASVTGLPVGRSVVLVDRARPLGDRPFDGLVASDEFEALACDEAVVAALEPVLGRDVTYLANSHIRAHLPGPWAALSWHQDAQFYGSGTEHLAFHMVQVWIPLSDVTVERGCLAVVPGSHDCGLLGTAVAGADNVRPSSSEQQAAIHGSTGAWVEGRNIVPLPVRRGDLVVFNPLLVHTGLPNASTEARWSADMRYTTTRGTQPLNTLERRAYELMHQRLAGRGHRPIRLVDGRRVAEPVH